LYSPNRYLLYLLNKIQFVSLMESFTRRSDDRADGLSTIALLSKDFANVMRAKLKCTLRSGSLAGVYPDSRPGSAHPNSKK
jgi:hypothetical protein